MIRIDIPADLNAVDDDDRNIAPCPAGQAAPRAGSIAVAGRPGFWSWVIVDEVRDGIVTFHQVTAAEAARHGDLLEAAT